MQRPGAATDLFNMFNENNIKYCHWKSNEHVLEGLRGITDLDILVDRKQYQAIQRLLIDCGFKRFKPAITTNYPAIEDYIALDRDTGNLIHCHMHYRLVVGEKGTKEYQLPWENILLNTRKWDKRSGMYAAEPEVEVLLLIIRYSLKLKFKDIIFNLLGVSYCKGNLKKEYLWLLDQIDSKKSINYCQELLGSKTSAIYSKIINRNLTLARLLKFKLSTWKKLSTFRSYNLIYITILSWFKKLTIYTAALNKKYFNFNHPLRRTIPNGGILIAIIGADGSGKSTISRKINSFWAWKLDVFNVYLGSGDGPSSFLRYPLHLARQKFFNQTRQPNVFMQPKKKNKIHKIAKTTWSLLLALEKRKKLSKAYRARNRGMLVITDRIPQDTIKGYNDGPMLSEWLGHPCKIFNWLAKWELKPYTLARTNPPDLVIKLNVTPGIALKRKHDMTIDEVEKRIQAIKKIKFHENTAIVDIDANQSLTKVYTDVKKVIWEYI